MQQQTPNAFIVTVIKEPEPETTVADVIIGSLGLAGALLVLALALGVVAGAILVAWNRFHPRPWRLMPPVSPSVSGADDLPSSRVR